MTYTYQGLDHPYYVQGKAYDLVVERKLFGRVAVYVSRGYEGRMVEGSYVKYKNFEAFRVDWNVEEDIEQ